MKKEIVLLLFGTLAICSLYVNAQTSSHDHLILDHLYTYASKNLNYSTPIPEDSVIFLCAQAEAIARKTNNKNLLFNVKLFEVNSYTLKGDVGLAVNKAQLMYDEAKKLNSELGLALSLQAIGTTYMRSNYLQLAHDALGEAEEKLQPLNESMMKIRLHLQQIHVCMEMNDMPGMHHYLIEVRKLLDRSEFKNKKDYVFYVLCYQTFYNIGIKDVSATLQSLTLVRNMKFPDHLFARWCHDLTSQYYNLIGDNEKALLYCDSALVTVRESKNLIEYKNSLIQKAHLLEKSGQKENACQIYEQTNQLTDSLNRLVYSRQIDSLHIVYLVDQMTLSNAAAHNRLLGLGLLYAFIFLALVAIAIVIIRKRNKHLIESSKQLKELREETSDSIQSKSLFLSNMSHELRTPLNAIVGFAELFASGAEIDAETKKQCSDLINQNAELLLRLFQDVADFSALRDSNIQFTYEHCDAVYICQNVTNTIEQVKRTSASVSFQTSIHSLPLYTDAGRLQQVLINLLMNATKFTPQGQILLQLTIDEEKQEAVFAIEDNGCGIPLEKQPKIFDRFEKLHEGVQGAGLGLSICRLIVEHMGGRIWVDSAYTQGARFVFTHPLNNEPKQAN